MASPSEKLCSPMPMAMNSEPLGLGQHVDTPGEAVLLHRRGAGADGRHRTVTALRHPLVVVDEAQQADAEAEEEHRGLAEERAPVATAPDGDFLECVLNRFDAAAERLHQQEDQDAGRDR